MASLFDAVDRPRVIINTNDIPSEDGSNVIFNKRLPLVDAVEKQPDVTVVPEVKPSIAEPEPEPSKVQAILDKLFGLHGQERYQLWPEKLAHDALAAPHDVMTGQIPQYEVDPVTGEAHTSSGMIKAAQDVSALAGTGGLAGAGSEAGMALGSGPILKSAMPEIKPFYSAVENAVAAAKQPKADAQQWLSFLKNQPGVKQEELAHLGLDKLSGAITKDDLLKAVQEGQPQIKEIIKGTEKGPFGNAAYDAANLYRQELFNKYGNGIRNKASKDELAKLDDLETRGEMKNPNPTKYHSYQLPGANNYREMLLTLPNKTAERLDIRRREIEKLGRNATSEQKQEWAEIMNRLQPDDRDIEGISKFKGFPDYKSSHWDEPNVLAHIRMNDRMIDGKKSLHLEEIQSDWHQAGRKYGYKGAEKSNADDWKRANANDLNDAQLLEALNAGAVPDAPFKKTWDELALKKALTEAVKNGYDQISWTPGEAQAARYDLSKSVDRLDLIPAETVHNGNKVNYRIRAIKDGKQVAEHYVKDQNEAASIVGKDVADKLFNSEKNNIGAASLTGQDLKVGGQGMKAFYDKMLVDKMNALTKKYRGKVESGIDDNVRGDVAPAVVYAKNQAGGDDAWKVLPKNQRETLLNKWKDLSNSEKYKFRRDYKMGHDVHVLKITPELREHVLKKGFPLFSAGVPVFSPVDGNPFEKKE